MYRNESRSSNQIQDSPKGGWQAGFPTGWEHGAARSRIFRRSENTVQRAVGFSDGAKTRCKAWSENPTEQKHGAARGRKIRRRMDAEHDYAGQKFYGNEHLFITVKFLN